MEMDILRTLTAEQKKADMPGFSVGDTVRVHFKIVEGKTERVQAYEGLVLCFKKSGIGRSFTVRKNSYGVGVERVFPLHSPRIQKVEVLRPGKVRRAKLYYIRGKVGKAAKIKELIRFHQAESVPASQPDAQ
jgi:large subunit ribosomal protein L19